MQQLLDEHRFLYFLLCGGRADANVVFVLLLFYFAAFQFSIQSTQKKIPIKFVFVLVVWARSEVTLLWNPDGTYFSGILIMGLTEGMEEEHSGVRVEAICNMIEVLRTSLLHGSQSVPVIHKPLKCPLLPTRHGSY